MVTIVKLDFLPGKKTYGLGVIFLAYGLLSALTPEMLSAVQIPPAEDFQRLIGEGLVILTGRKAIARLET